MESATPKQSGRRRFIQSAAATALAQRFPQTFAQQLGNDMTHTILMNGKARLDPALIRLTISTGGVQNIPVLTLPVTR